jgi:DNA-directed RNA polymerase subunit RPC12/RpoP
MEWRCEWCGKPHEENDPPCDSCGHSSFEKAVVRQTDLAEEEREATLVWVCTECGREHPKNSPPCSRCSNMTLEKQRQQIDDSELSAPGYLDVLTPQYAALLGVVLLFGSVLTLGFVGVIDLPGMSDSGVPGVENVPGNATTADGVSLAAVEDATLETLNQERESRGLSRLERSDGLDDIATFYNQKRVKEELADGKTPSRNTVAELFREECSSEGRFEVTTVTITDADADGLGATLAKSLIERPGWSPSAAGDTTGVDVHSAGGQLFVTRFVCDG